MKLEYFDGGKRGVPNPPKVHWTSVAKIIRDEYDLTWKQAIKKYQDLGRPNPYIIQKKDSINKYILDKNIEREDLLNKAKKLTKNKNEDIKKYEKDLLNKLTIKKKHLIEMIKKNVKPTESQFDDIKILLSGFVGQTSRIYGELPYDKYDSLDLSIKLLALRNIIKDISNYLKVYRDNYSTRKVSVKKDKVEIEDKKKETKTKSTKSTKSNLPKYELYYREQEDDEEDETYFKDIIKNLFRIRKLYKNKPNLNDEEYKIYNKIEDDVYELGLKVKKWFDIDINDPKYTGGSVRGITNFVNNISKGIRGLSRGINTVSKGISTGVSGINKGAKTMGSIGKFLAYTFPRFVAKFIR